MAKLNRINQETFFTTVHGKQVHELAINVFGVGFVFPAYEKAPEPEAVEQSLLAIKAFAQTEGLPIRYRL